jgi:hypothetical protein
MGETNTMKQATPAARDLARKLLTQEADGNAPSETDAHAALRTFEKIRLHVAKLVGAAGFQALLARALALAKAEVPWLEAVRVQADGSLEGFAEAAQQQNADVAAQGSATLLAQLLGLLITFVGNYLTLRLMCDIWPDACQNDSNPGTEETPQ